MGYSLKQGDEKQSLVLNRVAKWTGFVLERVRVWRPWRLTYIQTALKWNVFYNSTYPTKRAFQFIYYKRTVWSEAPNENIVQNHLNIALLNVF